MADVNANIGINFDTSQALAQLRQLQSGLSRFNQTLTQGNVAAMNAQKGLNSQLMQAINATGKFVATQKDVASSTSSFTQALEKNQMSMRQYFRYTAAAATQNTKVFKGMFAQERETLTRASKDRVKLLQSQYIQMQSANGDMIKTLQVVPKHLKMVNGQYADYATRMQMAAQRQQFLNKLLSQGSTQLLNFGKNTQWAGRQLMVGLTIPLSILGSTAAKTFMEMEQAVTKFTRVYGDMFTGGDATDKAIADIQRLGKEFTKYGIAVKDTVEMAASAAAMGLTGDALNSQVIQATRLSVLGQVEQQQALETTISLTNAFGIATEDLARKINFLNAVENQTVLSIEDLTIAVPKAGPVIKQLGGSVEDLAFFMTAMKEGGINASEGANALKSGLASMINPSKKASEFLADLGINITGLVEANKGDLKGTVVGFARALDTLDPLNRARAIEQLFGKFQFARLSTLFQNVTKDSSQAARALGLAGASVEELAILSERELGKVEDMTGNKFKKSMENLKLQLVPVGKAFLQAVTPIVNFVGKILEKFNGLSDGTKKVIAIMIGVIGGLAPIALMTFGILANGVANLIKFFAMLRGGIAKLNGSSNVLGSGFDYLTNQQIENLAQSNALHTSHSQLISTFNVEQASVNALAAAYGNAATQARALAQSSPGLFNSVPGPAGAVAGLPPKKFAQGGVVPGSGNKDTVPALLTPGEVVITKQTAKDNPELVAALQNGSVKRYNQGTGRVVTGDQQTFISQMASRSNDSAGVADEIGKQFEFINKTSAEKLIAYAQATGRTVTDSSEASLEQLRASLVSSVKSVIESAADAAESRGRQLTASGASTATKKVGTAGADASLHKFYNPRASQQQVQQFSHAETSTSIPIDQLSRTINITHEKTQSELLNLQRAIEASNQANGTNVAMPTASPVSGFGYMLQGQINKAMADGSPEIKKYKDIPGNTVPTIDAFLEDFSATGVSKWSKAVEIGGGNFEQLSGALQVYDDRLLQEVTRWKQANPGQIFDDVVFQGIEQTVRSQVAGLDTELGQVFKVARETVTGVRLHMDAEQKAIANADAVARGETNVKGEAYTADKPKYNERGTYQTGGTEVRRPGGQGNFIEVDEAAVTDARSQGATVGQAAIDGVRSEAGTAADSPSRKAIEAGKEVAEGLTLGMKEGQAGVSAQSSTLGNTAVPTEVINEKMDVGNKAFYDDLNNPEDYEERQILKSEDRQRRKLGARARVGSTSEAKEKSSLTPSVKKAKKVIAEGTTDTAKSTVLVAEKTDELANVTSDALYAQTQNTENLLTGAQITNATTGNLGEVLQATGATGIAQENIANSSESIAKVNEEIEKQKKIERDRLTKNNADEAARLAAENGIIPAGAQTNNNYVNPATAMGSVEAYDEASTYTRDKKGQILFDPETGQPTTLTKSQLGKKKRGMRKEKVGKVSGKAAGALGTAAMVAGMAGAPPQVTAALGGAATVAQFAPMIAGLTGPQGIVVALAAVAAGAYLFNKHLNAMAGKAAQFAKDLSATRSGLKAIGEMTGRVGASEKMDKRREKSQYGKYDEAVKIDDIFGKQFLGSEPGKKEKELFQKNVKEFGQDKAVSDLALKLATGVADGVLDSNAANSIAAALAIELKDAKLEMQVIGQLTSLIGPDGEDLEKEPMKARVAIMAKAGQRTNNLEDNVASKSGFGQGARKEVAALAALNMNNLELATMMADQVQVEYETAKQKLEAELASTANAQKKLEIETQLSALNAQNVKDTQFMNDQVLSQINRSAASFDKVYSGSVWGKQAMREDAYFDASKAQVESTYKGTDQEEASKTFLKKTKNLVNDTTYGEYNSELGKNVTTGLAGEKGAQQFQAKMEMLVGSKVLSPSEATSYMDLFSGKLNEMDFLLNAAIKTKGTSKTKELFGMFSGFGTSEGKKQATSIITEMVMKKKDPAQFDSMMETLKSIQALDGNTIDFEIMVTTIGLAGLETIKKEQAALEKIKEDAKKAGKTSLASEDGKTVDASADVSPNMKAATDALEKNEDRMEQFKKGTLEQQTEYLQKLAAQQIYEATVNDKTRTADIEFLAAQQAMNQAYIDGIAIGSDAYVAILAKNVAALKLLSDSDFAVEKLEMSGLGGVTSVGADVPAATPKVGGSNPLDFLDDLAMRIKNVRDGAFDATKPLQSMLAAFSNPKVKKDMSTAFKMFDGLQQRMIGMKVPKEFRDMIMGMSAKDFNELAKLTGDKAIFKFKKDKKGKALPKTKANIEGLTPTGVKMMKTYNEAIVGEANVVNRETVEQITNQETAFKMLIASGASATEALEHVQDAATAAAIASGALGKVGSPERKQYIEDLKKAASETERFALSQKMIMANEEFKLLEQMPKLSTAMQLAGFSADQMTEVLNDPALARHLIEDLKDGKVDSEEIANYLNSIEAKKIIDIQIKFNAGQFSESAKPGLELVDEMFAVQESLLRTGADPRTTAMVDTMNANNKSIKEAEASAAIFRRQIELINREIEKDQRAIEKNYSRPIESLSEEVNDLNRDLEMNPIFGDRAMEKLNTENTTLSNDLALISNAAEKINEKYDKQAEALQKVSNINDGILSQQKGQLDLADALSKGDISSAAQAMQANRADAAGRLQTDASDALEQARKNEIDGLRGPQSGLSEKDIQSRQFEISQQLYRMETDPGRVAIQEQIRVKQDEIYRLEELREGALLKIRDKEDKILEIQTKQLEPLEDKIEDLTYANTLIQEQIDKLVDEITVLDQTRYSWDRIKARIDANTLAGKDLDKQLGVLLASTDAIDKKWQSVLDKLKAYNKTPQGVLDAKNKTQQQAAADQALTVAEKELADAERAFKDATNKGEAGKFSELSKKVDAAKAKVATAKAAKVTADSTAPASQGLGTWDGNGAGGNGAGGNGAGGNGAGGNGAGGNETKNLKQGDAANKASLISTEQSINAQTAAADAAFDQTYIDKIIALGLPDPRKTEYGNYGDKGLNIAQRAKLREAGLDDDFRRISEKSQRGQLNAERAQTHPLLDYNNRPDATALADDNFFYFYSWTGTSWALYRALKTKENIGDYGSRSFGGPTDVVSDTDRRGSNSLTLQPQPIKNSRGEVIGYEIPDYPVPAETDPVKVAAVKAAAVAKAAAELKDKEEAEALAAGDLKFNEQAQLFNTSNPNFGTGYGNYPRKQVPTFSSGGFVSSLFNSGGYAKGTDTVPAMLTPGEFVMSKYAVQSQGIDKMKAINNGDSVGDSVYNYSINVNVLSESNPNEIARVVMAQIKSIDGQKMRGTRI